MERARRELSQGGKAVGNPVIPSVARDLARARKVPRYARNDRAGTVRLTALRPYRLTNRPHPRYSYNMRFTTYSKFHPELADAVNLQGLLDQLSDFLLQGIFLFVIGGVLVANFLVDVAYVAVDPRTRVGMGGGQA